MPAAEIDLSAILQAATGASTPGIDVTSAVNAAVTAAEGPEIRGNRRRATLADQKSDLTQRSRSVVTSLDNDLQALNSLTGPLSQLDGNLFELEPGHGFGRGWQRHRHKQ
jgi:flagellar hook-associated protein 2